MTIATDLRAVMSHFASGVTVVTTVGPDEEPLGTTVSAVASASLEPPLVLICLGTSSKTLQALRWHGAFGLNILGADQAALAEAFAVSGAATIWEELDTTAGVTGSPLIGDSLAMLDCRIHAIHPAGDHEIVLGRVVAADPGRHERHALLHFRRRLHGIDVSGLTGLA